MKLMPFWVNERWGSTGSYGDVSVVADNLHTAELREESRS